MNIHIKKYTYKGQHRYKPNFYGTYTCNGKKHSVTLCKIEGKPPKSLSVRDLGDAAFERSRQKAKCMMEDLIEKAHDTKNKAALIRKALEIQSGGSKEMEISIADLATLNRDRRRLKQPTESEMTFQTRALNRFASFATEHKVTHLWQVNQDLVDEYFKSLQAIPFSFVTISKHIYTAAGAFKRFAPTGLANPFSEIVEELKAAKRLYPCTHHRPLTETQVKKILDFAKNDPLLYPIIVCCLYTGLRLGDVATLRLSDIHWDKMIIHRKTNKTGAIVNCPIPPPLETVLKEAYDKRTPQQVYAFPDAAKIYSPTDPTLCVMGKKLFAKALFGDEYMAEDNKLDTPAAVVDPISPVEMMKLVSTQNFSIKKKERLNDIYCRYVKGQSYRQIEKETSHSRGQISEDLALMEKLAGRQIRPSRKNQHLRDLIAKTQEEGTSGKNRRSLYGWHSLRATSVVLALLSYRQPLELVRKNCGHSTVATTLGYFDPTEEHVFETIQSGKSDAVIRGWEDTCKEAQDKSLNAAKEILASLTNRQKALIKAML